MNHSFHGLGVAVATPFDADGSLHLDGLKRLLVHLVKGGVDFLIPLGTTGEASTLSDAERDAVISTTLENAQGRPVVAGCGSNDTAKAAAYARRAQQLGADGVLVVTPYYNKPNPDGLVLHYRAIADAAPSLPIILYNVPGRTGLNVVPDVLDRLWENPQIVALKESTGNMAQINEIARRLPPGKTLLSGDDYMAAATIAVGGGGLVSVMGNALPAETRALVYAGLEGRRDEAVALQRSLLPMMDALFCESNPVPLKALLQILGISTDAVRLPLAPAAASTRERLGRALEAATKRAPVLI